jgi:UTP--glucose-1-phosphate uridylyltransferase
MTDRRCYAPTTPAVILAGGWGRRMLPATAALPKGLLPVGGVPLVEHVASELIDAGIEEIHVVIREEHRILRTHFSNAPPWGGMRDAMAGAVPSTGDGALQLRFHTTAEDDSGASLLNLASVLAERDFLLSVVDELVEDASALHGELRRAREDTGHTVIAVHDPGGSAPDRLCIREVAEPSAAPHRSGPGDASRPRMMGRYFCTPEVLEELRRPGADRQGASALYRALDRLAKKGRLAGTAYRGHWWDCGQLAGYTAANVDFALARADLREHVISALNRSGSRSPVPSEVHSP